MLRISPALIALLVVTLLAQACNVNSALPNPPSPSPVAPPAPPASPTPKFEFVNVTENQTLKGQIPAPGAKILNASTKLIVTELRRSDGTLLQTSSVTTGTSCVTNPCSTWDTTKYPDGSYFVRITATLNDGSEMTAQLGFKIANTAVPPPPAVELVFVNITEGQVFKSAVQSPGGKILNAATKSIVTELRKSDATWLQDTTVTTGTGCVINPCGTWDTTKYANGAYFVRLVATLTDGKQIVAQRNFEISNVMPPPPSPPPPASPPAPPPSPPPGSGYATPPTAPQPYTLPANAVHVNNTADFIKQFTSSSAKDIVLENGIYDNPAPVMAAAPHRIWAAQLGGARLRFGLAFESNFSSAGAAVHGLTFDITNPATTSSSAVIRIAQAPNTNVTIEDVTINGNRSVNAGIQAFNSSGLIVRRCAVSDVFDAGILLQGYGNVAYTYVPNQTPLIEDCDVKNVYRDQRGSNNGKSEACMWIGVTVTVRRVRLQNCGWMGLWTGSNANNARFSDLTILDTDKGIYVEHWTRNTIFERFQIGPLTGTAGSAGIHTRLGIITEWADPAYTGLNPVPGESLAASHSNTIQNGFISSYLAGVFTDDAEGTTVAGVTFANQRFTGISEFRNDKTKYDTIWQNQGNNFSGMTSGATQYTRYHINDYNGPVP